MRDTHQLGLHQHVTAETTEKNQQHKKQNRLSAGFGITPMEWAASALIGVGTAVAAAIGTVRALFKDDMKNATDIKARVEEHAQALSEEKPQGTSKLEQKQFRLKIRELKTIQAGEIEQMINEKYQFSRNFFTSTLQRADTFTETSRRPIVLNAILGSIVGMAMAISFFNSVAIRDKINQVDDLLEPKDDPKHPHAKDHGTEDEKHHARTKPDHKVTEAHSEKTLEAKREHSLAS